MKSCIDPGHGMSNRKLGIYDPGATHFENGFEYQEASIALRYGLALKDVLRAQQLDVFMTRDDETDHTPVGRRASMAKAAGCDVLISLHLNDFDDDTANGLEVLYGNPGSKALAQKLQDALVDVTKIRNRKIKMRTDLAVLKFEGTAVLVELGFIANDQDREKLLNAQIRDAVVHTIAKIVNPEFWFNHG
ncbi:MAG: N-acetylmuramoyl-L-alanine amidase [Proteobacteria bacterium]|nr:N-acetylmuramoyl-L-alanine amidase [Pseudomonadota bacterium]